MTREEQSKELEKIFHPYCPNGMFKTIATVAENNKNKIPARYLRKMISELMFRSIADRCSFDSKFHTLLMCSTDDEYLNYTESLEFMIEYGKSVTQKKEHCITMMSFMDGEDLDVKLLAAETWFSDTIFANADSTNAINGTYVIDKEAFEKLLFVKKRACREYLEKVFTKASIKIAKKFRGHIYIFMDEILGFLYCYSIPFTKDALRMAIDFVLGHERTHKKMDNKSGQYYYIGKHWKNAYNRTGHDAVEQECNRGGLMNTVKQLHIRKKLNME